MEKTILFPFDVNDDNRSAYTKALELAKEKEAKLVLLTAIPEQEYEAKIDSVYFHLLELNGYYQAQNNDWKSTTSVSIERKIESGNLLDHLETILIENIPEWIINPSLSSAFNWESLEKLLGIQKTIVIDL